MAPVFTGGDGGGGEGGGDGGGGEGGGEGGGGSGTQLSAHRRLAPAADQRLSCVPSVLAPR